MIPYEIDPSLHPAEREPELLEDGFSASVSAQRVADGDGAGDFSAPFVNEQERFLKIS